MTYTTDEVKVMVGRQAKLLTDTMINRALKHAELSRHPHRNKAMILLSAKAGLRACEIAGLAWGMVLTANYRVGRSLEIQDAISKRGRGRVIPMHTDLRQALTTLKRNTEYTLEDPVITSERGTHLSAASVVNWFGQLYAELGFVGCSSHSGRRTFITRAARAMAKSGGSLRDVQELAGHASLNMTERYIEGDRDSQRRIIDLI